MKGAVVAALIATSACSSAGTQSDVEVRDDSVGCVDAAPPSAVVADDAGGLFADSAGNAWVVDADSAVQSVDIAGITDSAEGVLGGDGRVWILGEDGDIAALDPQTGDVEVGPGLPTAVSDATRRLVSTPDGAGVVGEGTYIQYSGSPITDESASLPSFDGEMVIAAALGPDGLLWIASDAAIVAIDTDLEVVASADTEGSPWVTLFVGNGCAIADAWSPAELVVVGRDGQRSFSYPENCVGSGAAVHDGVAWMPCDAVTRLDLATGTSTSTPVFDCGEGAMAVAGPGGVAVLDSCDIAVASLDPGSGELLDRRNLDEDVEDPADAVAWGQWPWAGFEGIILELPSLEPADLDIDPAEPVLYFDIIATIPPAS